MKKNREKLRAEFLAEAGELFDELMAWDDETQEPDLTQIEEIVLKLRVRFGEQLAEKLLEQQESGSQQSGCTVRGVGEKW